MDEQTVDAQNTEQIEQSTEQLESTSEQHLENQEASSEEIQEEQQQVSSQEDDGQLSPRQQKRVDQIEEKAKELKFNKILDRIEQSKHGRQQDEIDEKLIDYKDTLDAPDDIYEQLERDRQAASEQGYSKGLKQAQSLEWKTNLRLDLPTVKEQLDRLDPVDAEAIDKEYLYYSGYDPKTGTVQNPNISYADFVEARVEQATRLAERLAVRSQKNIAQQASKTGVRPSGGTAQRGVNVTSAEDIANMSVSDWDKNKDAILKQLGISKYDNPYS